MCNAMQFSVCDMHEKHVFKFWLINCFNGQLRKWQNIYLCVSIRCSHWQSLSRAADSCTNEIHGTLFSLQCPYSSCSKSTIRMISLIPVPRFWFLLLCLSVHSDTSHFIDVRLFISAKSYLRPKIADESITNIQYYPLSSRSLLTSSVHFLSLFYQ